MRKSKSGNRNLKRALAASGVSALAIAAMGIAAPAMAQDADEESDVQNVDDDGAIVVTGRRAALQEADERKRDSETIIDSIVADDAGKLPDNSITEVLQRVSGVTIVRFAALNDPDHYSVEGTGIQVRGLTGVASRLNGREIFSASNGRALQFADVTPELMAAVDVYKGSTADLIEGGTGGQIDLRTKVPFDFDGDLHAAITTELSVGDLANAADFSGSILLTDSFSTPIGQIGILADYAYSELTSHSHFIRTEPYFRTAIDGDDYYIPGGFTFGEEQFRRNREGLYGAIQWEPSDSLLFTGTFFQSRYENTSGDWGVFVSSQTLAVDPAQSTFDSNNLLLSTPQLFNRDPGTFNPAGPITTGGNKGAYDSETTTTDYSLSFDWNPGSGPLSISGSLQRVDSDQVYSRLDVFRDVAFSSGFGFELSGDFPRVTVPEGTQEFLLQPENYFWSASMPHQEDNRGRLDAAQLDIEYDLNDDFFRSVKFGGRIAERTERDANNSYQWAALGRGWNGDPQLTFANAAPGDVELHVFDDFFHGNAALPANMYFPTDDLVRRFNTDRTGLTASPPENFCGAPFSTDLWWNCSAAGPLPDSTYGGLAGQPELTPLVNSTKNYAAYGLVRFGAPDDTGISGNVGARLVHIKNEGEGSITQNGGQFVRDGELFELAATSVPRDGKAEFTYVLPSVNLNYSPDPDVKLRLGYNITLDLPTFQALRAYGQVGAATTAGANPGDPPIFVNFTTDTGNPQLKPTLSNNFDASVEWYPRPGTTFHFAPFYKRLTNLPIYGLTERELTVEYTDGSTETVLAAASDYSNATEAATVKGFEIGGRIFFDMLPGFLSGFGFEGNYTLIDSENPGDLYRDINGTIKDDAPLVGLSRHNFNATLLYEQGVVSARVAYSWRSKYLQSTNSNGTNPLYNYYGAPGTPSEVQIALPVYGDEYGQLEAGVRFKVTDNFQFSVQGTNLLNSTQRTLMGGYPGGDLVGRSWFQTDRRIAVGVNLAL